jgi:hypothetical protein
MKWLLQYAPLFAPSVASDVSLVAPKLNGPMFGPWTIWTDTFVLNVRNRWLAQLFVNGRAPAQEADPRGPSTDSLW